MSAVVDRTRSALIDVQIVEDDGDVHGAVCATFNEGDSHVRYALGKDGKIWLLGIYSDGDISGREIVTWLAGAYGRPVCAAEVASSATGFWDKMVAEGLVEDWIFDRFVGSVVAMPELVATGGRGYPARSPTSVGPKMG